MTYWLTNEWRARTTGAIQRGLEDVHNRLIKQGLGNKHWTVAVLQALVPVAQAACCESDRRSQCGLKCPPDADCTGEWLYDFSCALVGLDGKGFFGLPMIAECEWGPWCDIWDDFDKLMQARAGLRVLIFNFNEGDTPRDWHEILSRRARGFAPAESDDGWLFVCWSRSGFEFRSGLLE